MTTFDKEKQRSIRLSTNTRRICTVVSIDLWTQLRARAQEAQLPFGEWMLKTLCDAAAATKHSRTYTLKPGEISKEEKP